MGVGMQIAGGDIPSTSQVAAFQALGAHRNEFHGVAAGAGRMGKTADDTFPEDILFPLHHPRDIGLEGSVAAHGDPAREIRVIPDVCVVVFLPPDGVTGLPYQFPEGISLEGFIVCRIVLHGTYPVAQKKTYQRGF